MTTNAKTRQLLLGPWKNYWPINYNPSVRQGLFFIYLIPLTINLGKSMSSKNLLLIFSRASLDSSVALSVSNRTKFSRDSVFAAMSSKMNVVIWNEFSLNRKSLGSSSFLQQQKHTLFSWQTLVHQIFFLDFRVQDKLLHESEYVMSRPLNFKPGFLVKCKSCIRN